MTSFTFNFRYQQYISNSGRNLPDRDCMVQQEYEVDVEETYEPEKVCSFFAHLYLASYNQGCGNSKNLYFPGTSKWP